MPDDDDNDDDDDDEMVEAAPSGESVAGGAGYVRAMMTGSADCREK